MIDPYSFISDLKFILKLYLKVFHRLIHYAALYLLSLSFVQAKIILIYLSLTFTKVKYLKSLSSSFIKDKIIFYLNFFCLFRWKDKDGKYLIWSLKIITIFKCIFYFYVLSLSVIVILIFYESKIIFIFIFHRR